MLSVSFLFAINQGMGRGCVIWTILIDIIEDVIVALRECVSMAWEIVTCGLSIIGAIP